MGYLPISGMAEENTIQFDAIHPKSSSGTNHRSSSKKAWVPFRTPMRVQNTSYDASSDMCGIADAGSLSSRALNSRRRGPKKGPSGHLFKSPLKSYKGIKEPETVLSVALENDELRKKCGQIDTQIVELSAQGVLEDEHERYIRSLHEYNGVKDLVQMLLGRLAEKRGITLTKLYTEFGLELSD